MCTSSSTSTSTRTDPSLTLVCSVCIAYSILLCYTNVFSPWCVGRVRRHGPLIYALTVPYRYTSVHYVRTGRKLNRHTSTEDWPERRRHRFGTLAMCLTNRHMAHAWLAYQHTVGLQPCASFFLLFRATLFDYLLLVWSNTFFKLLLFPIKWTFSY
jgi:hypothetical protein